MLEQPALGHFHLALNVQVAALTERREVPLRAVGFVVVQVVDGQSVAGLWVMRVVAAFALVAFGLPEGVAKLLGPARRVSALELAEAFGHRVLYPGVTIWVLPRGVGSNAWFGGHVS
jgi:hypothetical protein